MSGRRLPVVALALVVAALALSTGGVAGPTDAGTGTATLSQSDTATVDTNADIDNDGSVDELSVAKAGGQTISGTATVPAGTELDIRVTGTDSGSPFVKTLNATVRPDATWRTTADFSGNAQGANFTVRVERNGTALLSEPVDGRIYEKPTGSVTFNDQQSDGDAVTVFSATASNGGFVTIRPNVSGNSLGTSEYIPPGSEGDIQISLTEPVDEDTTLVAMLHQDTDGDQSYEFEFGSSVDAPYTENGSAVTDSAEITIPDPADVSVTVDGTNAPVTAGETLTVTATAENVGDLTGAQTVTLSDGDGTVLDRQSVSLSAGATETVTLSWATTEADVGERTLTVASENDTATTAVTVTSTNADPVARDDSYRLQQNTTLTVDAPGVLGNDSDPDGDTLTASVVDGTEDGTLSLSGDGSFTYTPDSGFTGADSFTYAVSDGDGGSATATASLSVEPSSRPDTPPTFAVALTSTNSSVEAGEDLRVTADIENAGGTAGTQTVTLSDGDGTVLDRRSVSLSAGATETVTLSWTTTGADVGERTLTVASENDTATTAVTVTSPNADPVARDDSYRVQQNTTLTVDAPGVVGDDSDPDGDPLTASVVDGTEDGTLSLSGDGSFTYTPDTGFAGQDRFTYTVRDGEGGSATATVAISVDTSSEPVDGPTFSVDVNSTTAPVTAGERLRVTARVTNTGGTDGTQRITLGDGNGTVLDRRSVSVAAGTTQTVTLSWATTEADVGERTLTVASENDTATTAVTVVSSSTTGPVARDDSYRLMPNTTFIVPAPGVVGNDSDPAGGNLTVSLVAEPTNGTLSLSDTGRFVYTPDPGFDGRDTFTYAVRDSAGATDTATVSLSVGTPTFAVAGTSTNGPVEAGEDLRVTVTVENRGALRDTQRLELRDPAGTTVDSTTVTLSPGAVTSRTLVWSTPTDAVSEAAVTVATPTGTATEAVVIQDGTDGSGTGDGDDGDGNDSDGSDGDDSDGNDSDGNDSDGNDSDGNDSDGNDGDESDGNDGDDPDGDSGTDTDVDNETGPPTTRTPRPPSATPTAAPSTDRQTPSGALTPSPAGTGSPGVTQSTTDGSGPGFGPALALVAVVLAALWGRRSA